MQAFSCGSLSVRLDPFGPAAGRLSLRLATRLGPALRGYRLVMFDQRGTGAGALDCPALQQQMGTSDLTVPAPAAVRSCAAAIGPSRQYFATADTVADIEALISGTLQLRDAAAQTRCSVAESGTPAKYRSRT